MTSEISVSIVRWVDDEPQPGIVECRFTDRFGKEWLFIEKSAVVSSPSPGRDSLYPLPGVIGCRIISTGLDDAGREIAVVDTEKPWGIESVDGNTRFEVFAVQLLPS
jgi:hypothetical protein